jgi:hypothetical protein
MTLNVRSFARSAPSVGARGAWVALALIPGAAAIKFGSAAARAAGELAALEALGRADAALAAEAGFTHLLEKLASVAGAELSTGSVAASIGAGPGVQLPTTLPTCVVS